MLQIQDTLVSLDIIDEYFVCDLSVCKGICCVEGDAGAPVEEKEIKLSSHDMFSFGDEDCIKQLV